MRRGLQDYAAEATDAARAAEQVMTTAFAGMEDALVGFVTTGKLEVRALADSILGDLTRIAVRQAITGPLAAALFGTGGGAAGTGSTGLPGLLAGLLHEGGIAGVEQERARLVDPVVFAGAPRFHGGGIAGSWSGAGLAPDEVPAILRRGRR